MSIILLNAQNPISRDEAFAAVRMIEHLEQHVQMTGLPALDVEERAVLTKLKVMAGIPDPYAISD